MSSRYVGSVVGSARLAAESDSKFWGSSCGRLRISGHAFVLGPSDAAPSVDEAGSRVRLRLVSNVKKTPACLLKVLGIR